MRQKCFYNQSDCSDQMTREHVVSRSVLKVAFGDPIRNFVSGGPVGNKQLVDHEAVIKDVCAKCNNGKLTDYDTAGAAFVDAIARSGKGDDVFPFSQAIFGWLLKTHFNYFRMIRDAARDEAYIVPQPMKDALVQRRLPPPEMYRLHIETFDPEPSYFDAEHPQHINWIGYRSVRLLRQGVVVSDLRLKHLTTWLIVPANGKLRRCGQRSRDAIDELRTDFGGHIPAALDVSKALETGQFRSPRITPPEIFRSLIYKV